MQQDLNFEGLWYTDEGYFVLVNKDNEVWGIDSKGNKTVLLEINKNGITNYCGQLMQRKIGEEHTVKGTLGVVWPIIRETEISIENLSKGYNK